MATEAPLARFGRELASARQAAGWSLRQAATKAGISTAYLQKLERGSVAQPSPKVLRQVSDAYDLDYSMLMRLAGYDLPASPPPTGPLSARLAAADLTAAEQRAVAAFIDHLVAQRPSDS